MDRSLPDSGKILPHRPLIFSDALRWHCSFVPYCLLTFCHLFSSSFLLFLLHPPAPHPLCLLPPTSLLLPLMFPGCLSQANVNPQFLCILIYTYIMSYLAAHICVFVYFCKICIYVWCIYVSVDSGRNFTTCCTSQTPKTSREHTTLSRTYINLAPQPPPSRWKRIW